jgi:hypothetical protein
MFAKSSPLGVDPRNIAQVSPQLALLSLNRAQVFARSCPCPAHTLAAQLHGLAATACSPEVCLPAWLLQRIMEIRSQIAKEWIEELKQVRSQGGGSRPGAHACCRAVGGRPGWLLWAPLPTPTHAHPLALAQVSEENAILMRETVASSFTLADLPVVDPAQVGPQGLPA